MRGPSNRILRDQSGIVLVITMIMLIVLTLIGIASIITSTLEMRLSGNKRGATDAFYTADSGIQVIVSNPYNFDLPEKFVSNKSNPFTDPNNPNPNGARAFVEYLPGQKGAPRGYGISATQFDFEHYIVESSGEDQMELNPIRSRCTIQEKVIKLVPTMQ